MNEMFSQGGKGSVGIQTSKQAIARKHGVKQSEVIYFKVGVDLGGYKVIYDATTQRSFSMPLMLSGTTAVSLTTAGVLTHSAGNVDLGNLSVLRGEFVTVPGSFDAGATVNTKNELVMFIDGTYRWAGALPKTVVSGSTPLTSGGVGDGLWIPVDIQRKVFDYVNANRGPSNQTIASGSDVTLVFNNLKYGNDLGNYSTTTGQYTATFSGIYRVALNLQLNGVTDGVVSIKSGSGTLGYIPVTVANSLALVNGVQDVFLNTGDSLFVSANLVGSSPALVAGTVSTLSITHI